MGETFFFHHDEWLSSALLIPQTAPAFFLTRKTHEVRFHFALKEWTVKVQQHAFVSVTRPLDHSYEGHSAKLPLILFICLVTCLAFRCRPCPLAARSSLFHCAERALKCKLPICWKAFPLPPLPHSYFSIRPLFFFCHVIKWINVCRRVFFLHGEKR